MAPSVAALSEEHIHHQQNIHLPIAYPLGNVLVVVVNVWLSLVLYCVPNSAL